MRRGRIRIRNKMGFQIVTILIFTIILPSIFFFWFIVQRYSNDLLSAAISERENLLEAINKSISLHFDNVQELSMTIYYDTSTKNYIDGHAYEEPSPSVSREHGSMLWRRDVCLRQELYKPAAVQRAV